MKVRFTFFGMLFESACIVFAILIQNCSERPLKKDNMSDINESFLADYGSVNGEMASTKVYVQSDVGLTINGTVLPPLKISQITGDLELPQDWAEGTGWVSDVNGTRVQVKVLRFLGTTFERESCLTNCQ